MKSFLVRLDDGLHAWLKGVSVERGFSMNSLVVELLEWQRRVGEFSSDDVEVDVEFSSGS